MSAGTGIMHSEYNFSQKDRLNLFQIWIFPNEKNISPRYDQKTFSEEERNNRWQLLVSPNKNNGSLWINQDAYLNRVLLSPDSKIDYTLHSKDNGLYMILIDGKIEVGGDTLYPKDALGISEVNHINIASKNHSDILLIEIPMT
jgi:redox-sensitive bicupin YhaK (pirin superfamily)